MEIKDKWGTSNDSLDSVNLSCKMIYDVLKWISEQNTILNMPYCDGETNMGDETELHGFKIQTQYTSTHINVSFSTDDGTVITTRQDLEESIE